MKTLMLIGLMLPGVCFGLESIECEFDRFHEINHEVDESSAYFNINQKMTIINGETSKETLKLDGPYRATNSTSWSQLGLKGWESELIILGGNFGELLTVKKLMESNQHKGWYESSLVTSDVVKTYSMLGRCKVK